MCLLAIDRALTKRPAETKNPAAIYLARLAPGSRRTMRQALDAIAEILAPGLDAATCPWHLMRYEHAQAVRARLAERHAFSTANKMLSALRGVLREAWRLGQIDAESYHRAVDIARVRGSRELAGRAIAEGEIRAMVQACADGTPGGARDAAILALLAVGGLRRAEVASLDLGDVDVPGETIRVHGKGNKQRLVPLTNGGLDAVKDWIRIRGSEPGPLLCPVDKADRLAIRRLSTQAIYRAVARRAEVAGVTTPTPHDFRRTFATGLLEQTGDVVVTQRLMGHASPATTARYDRRDEKAQRAAVRKMHFPYVRPRKGVGSS